MWGFNPHFFHALTNETAHRAATHRAMRLFIRDKNVGKLARRPNCIDVFTESDSNVRTNREFLEASSFSASYSEAISFPIYVRQTEAQRFTASQCIDRVERQQRLRSNACGVLPICASEKF